VGYENAINEKDERLIWLDRAVVDRMRAFGEGESYGDVILRGGGGGDMSEGRILMKSASGSSSRAKIAVLRARSSPASSSAIIKQSAMSSRTTMVCCTLPSERQLQLAMPKPQDQASG
jgi:hypothetical protein